jgi:hypothetical protein
MAALFLFILAIVGGVVVGDLVWENNAVAEVSVFGRPVTGYSQGWLLAVRPCLALLSPCCWWPRWGRPRDAGSVAGSSAGCGVIDASTEPSRKRSTPACWISGSAAMTPAPDLVVGW